MNKEEESGAEIHRHFVDNVLEKQEPTEHQRRDAEFLECHTQTEIMKEKRLSSSSRSFIPRQTTIAEPLHLISAKKLSECMSSSGSFLQ